MGQVPSQEEMGDSLHPLSAMQGHSEKGAICKAGRGLPPDTDHLGTLIWLQEKANSDSMWKGVLWLAFHCFRYYEVKGAQSCPTLQPHGLYSPWNSLGQNTEAQFVVIIIYTGRPQRILPLCLTVKLKWLCSEPCSCVDGRKKEINTSPCWKFAILRDNCKMDDLFNESLMTFFKEPGIRTPTSWLFWDISLPSSLSWPSE